MQVVFGALVSSVLWASTSIGPRHGGTPPPPQLDPPHQPPFLPQPPVTTGGTPGSPRTPGPAPAATPTGPAGPTAGGPQAPGSGATGGSGANPSTPKFANQDLADWRLWWTFHKDEFLDLKATLAQGAQLVTGEEALLNRTTTGAQLPDPKKLRAEVVPALLRMLQGERNPDVLTSSMVALAKLGRGPCPEDAPAIEAAVKPFLADPVQEVTESAALALGLNAAPSSAPLLVALAQDDERGRALVQQTEVPYRTRAFACYGLGLLGARGNADVRRFAVHHLVQTFEKDKGAARDVKVAVLVALALLPVEGPARTDGTEAPSSSLEADLAWLSGVWRDVRESELVRAYAATTAGRLASASRGGAVDTWKLALCDALEPTSSVPGVLRQSAALALGSITDNDDDEADTRARALLTRAAREGDGLARRFALVSLARAGARDGRGARTSEHLVETRRFLLGELEGGSSALRPWIALALGVCEAVRLRAGADASDEVRAALVKGLAQHKSPSDAGALCLAAALARASNARDAIVAAATSGDDAETRPHAALALGLLGWDGAVITLRKAVIDARNKPLLLREASIGLGLLGSTDNVPNLVRMLGEQASTTWMAAITGALSYVGDARAVDPLLALLPKGERPDSVRAFAAAALGGICDRELLPWNAPMAFLVNYSVPPATLYEPTSGTGILDLF
ncbi:MAG: HEAT repeat domain-containing protein [Planctomycetes bacterium]|nr:HEAT repeat domain-containing protein [Planctomycetota bacterium]